MGVLSAETHAVGARRRPAPHLAEIAPPAAPREGGAPGPARPVGAPAGAQAAARALGPPLRRGRAPFVAGASRAPGAAVPPRRGGRERAPSPARVRYRAAREHEAAAGGGRAARGPAGGRAHLPAGTAAPAGGSGAR